MDKQVFTSRLDFQKYAEKRLLEIEDLSQRRQLRETLNGVFLHLYDYIEGEYQGLETKLLLEEKQSFLDMSVHTSIIPRDLFDQTDEYLVPMNIKDIEELEVDVDELISHINQKTQYALYNIMLKADYKVVKRLEQEARIFTGIIVTDQGKYDATFTVKQNKEYLKIIENLYKIFINNHIPWTTIFAPYLYKIFKVFLNSIEGWRDDLKIEEIQIDFEEYENFVHYDCIPVWNIATQVEKSSTYPEPCWDHINYEHVIYRHRLDQDANYLIGSVDFSLQNIKRIQGDLFITCDQEYPVKWVLYKFKKMSHRNYPYPIFTNQAKEDVSEVLHRQYQASIKTKAELERFLIGLGYQDDLKFENYRFERDEVDNQENYHLDYFIADEFRTAGYRMTMVLEFVSKRLDYHLNRDIMSYLVTQVQKKFPEYDCIGLMR